jgi:transcriptional regulator with XRE-family HTH domain
VKAYEALRPQFEIYEAMIVAMKKSGITQTELAERMKTTKSSVSRTLGGKFPPSWSTIMRFAEATGTRPVLQFVPQ